jgi:hypothetical protein
MTTILLTIGFLAALMLAMAVGVIFRGKPLKGSCGGIAGGNCLCLDGKPVTACAIKGRDAGRPDRSLRSRTTDDGVIVYE